MAEATPRDPGGGDVGVEVEEGAERGGGVGKGKTLK